MSDYIYAEYPKMAYKAGENPVTVSSAEAFKALGKGWQETPVSVPVEDQSKVVGLNMSTPIAQPTEKDGAGPVDGADAKDGVK
jgi:hypothetical protein